MIRIAIVDDENKEIELVCKITLNFFEKKKIQISINSFTSGEDFLDDTIPYDLVFLDIQMNGMDGIETAQRLRAKNKKAVLLYVTSYRNYIEKSMTIHPFAFIVKPYSEKEICKNLDDYLSYIHFEIENKFKEIYQIHTTDDRNFSINMDDIMYFHYLQNRIIEVITVNGTLQIKASIMNVYSTVNHDYFIVPNQSFIANLHHIKEIEGKNKKLVMKDGGIILIARRKYDDILTSLNQYITGEK